MGSRTEKGPRDQGGREVLRQLLLPMVGGMQATKRALFGLVQESGMLAKGSGSDL